MFPHLIFLLFSKQHLGVTAEREALLLVFLIEGGDAGRGASLFSASSNEVKRATMHASRWKAKSRLKAHLPRTDGLYDIFFPPSAIFFFIFL